MQTRELSLANTEMGFKIKKDEELARSQWLFKFMRYPFLVKVLSKSVVYALRLRLPVKWIIKVTIFNQFCGGESLTESSEVISRLNRAHVGSILDYSIEGKENEEDFEHCKDELIKIISIASGNKAIPYTSLKLTGIGRSELLEKKGGFSPLTISEEVEYAWFYARLDSICKAAMNKIVPIYFDAEETWVQNIIDILSEELMEKYNKENAIVLTTLQMYRRDKLDYLSKLIQKAKERHFLIGIKLVRGAYLEKENARAIKLSYTSPIHIRKEDTDRDFDSAIDLCLENIEMVTLCAGTHNEASTLYVIKRMRELSIPPDHPHVYFSQLYGMSDHITFNLADAGYNVTKYLPYGPIKSVIPYLIRRAQENTSIEGQIGRELSMLTEERKRREQSRLLEA